ncbi:DUF3347 domain-containing protein [Flaviaesturariibacter terrae]
MNYFLVLLLTLALGTGAGAQQASIEPSPARLLRSYLQLKDALVAGNAAGAAAAADSFSRAANAVDYKLVSEDNIRILVADAGLISGSTSLAKQRTVFANLSHNMQAVAQAVKLSDAPVYIQYCPMKKATWLSTDQSIRNPYYGNAMLTCGEVQSTIR